MSQFIFEGMEESGSVGLEAYIKREKKSLFKVIIVINQNNHLMLTSPIYIFINPITCEYIFIYTYICSNIEHVNQYVNPFFKNFHMFTLMMMIIQFSIYSPYHCYYYYQFKKHI